MVMRILRAAPLLAALALPACGSSDAGACGSFTWREGNASCNSCMASSCCPQLAACDSGTACARLSTCIDGCAAGDAACANDCVAAQPDGKVSLDALLACYEQSCQDDAACQTRVCQTDVVVTDPDCGGCLSASCCDTWGPCAADAACKACLTTSPAPAECAGNALYQSANACLLSACGATCAATICDSDLGTSSAACNACLGQPDSGAGCCETIKACKDDVGCYSCITGTAQAGCESNAAWNAFTACVDAKCASPCNG